MKEPRDIAFLFDIMKSIMSIFIIFGPGMKARGVAHANSAALYMGNILNIAEQSAKSCTHICDKCNIQAFFI